MLRSRCSSLDAQVCEGLNSCLDSCHLLRVHLTIIGSTTGQVMPILKQPFTFNTLEPSPEGLLGDSYWQQFSFWHSLSRRDIALTKFAWMAGIWWSSNSGHLLCYLDPSKLVFLDSMHILCSICAKDLIPCLKYQPLSLFVQWSKALSVSSSCRASQDLGYCHFAALNNWKQVSGYYFLGCIGIIGVLVFQLLGMAPQCTGRALSLATFMSTKYNQPHM